jgi:Flp pilus assembly pilin Flp
MPNARGWSKLFIARLRAAGDRGASSVEYAFLVSLIAVVIIAAVYLLGGHEKCMYNNAANAMPTGSSPAPSSSPAC